MQLYIIKLCGGCAEAEAEANALRKRGVQLERHAQRLRSASKGSKALKVFTTHTAEEVSASHQHASPLRLMPCPQGPAEQVHEPLSGVSQLPAPQSEQTQQAPEQHLPSEQAVSLDAAQQHQQQQLLEVATAATLQQAEAPVAAAAEQVTQQVAVSAQTQAAAPQQEERLPVANAGAAAAHQEAAQGAVAQREAPAQGNVLQGMVVWGNVKGWPAWPGLVTTEEEMDVAEVIGKRGQLLQGM